MLSRSTRRFCPIFRGIFKFTCKSICKAFCDYLSTFLNYASIIFERQRRTLVRNRKYAYQKEKKIYKTFEHCIWLSQQLPKKNFDRLSSRIDSNDKYLRCGATIVKVSYIPSLSVAHCFSIINWLTSDGISQEAHHNHIQPIFLTLIEPHQQPVSMTR